MEYQEKTVQRIFSIRFSGGDRIIESLEKLIEEKNIRAGAILFAGAFSDGNLVSGFRKHSRKPMDFNPMSFSQTQEVIGMGSISWVGDRPKIRLQAGIGKEREVFIGRVEEAGAAGAEAFVLEFSGNSFTS
jgi:predicted DNA-binding protein with PD1-like motif